MSESTDPSVVRLADYGNMLGARVIGAQAREAIERLMVNGGCVVVDASGVSAMSPGFADECFGKIAERIGWRALSSALRVRNAAPSVGIVLKFTIADRVGIR